jgi:hypothetical protein
MPHTHLTVPDDNYRHGDRFTPPPLGAEPRLYALLAVEMTPGHIAYFHIELDHTPGACTIDLDQDTEDVHSLEYLNPIARVPSGPTHITAALTGTIVSRAADYRRPTRAPSTIAENALDGVTRRLPLTDGRDR